MSYFIFTLTFYTILFLSSVLCAAPLTCNDVFDQLSQNAGRKHRLHPQSVNKISIGQEYYVSEQAFKNYPSIAKNIKGSLKVKILKILPKSSTRSWKGPAEIVYLYSHKTGSIGIELQQLQGNIYSQKNYAEYAPFEEGEYVQIGSNNSESNTYTILNEPHNSITLAGEFSAFIGQFKRVHDEGHYVVRIQNKSQKISPTYIIVPRDLTYGLNTGSISRFKNSVNILLDLPLQFKPNEKVRFRKVDGSMTWGTFVRSEKNQMFIEDPSGVVIGVSPRSVFRYIEGHPLTPVYNANWIGAISKKPSDLVLQFLDAAGKLESLPDFAKANTEQKISILLKYLESNITWTEGALRIEDAGLDNFNEILCAGAGVCRHISVLMATLLNEYGYNARIVKYVDLQRRTGHAWIEVDAKTEDGKMTTLVVDPSNDFIRSLRETYRLAEQDKESFSARYYTQPERSYLVD